MSIVKLNNRGIRSATAVGTTTQLGDMVFIKKLTASSSSTLSFVDGSSSVVLDNTYKEYIFTFKDIHPATDNVDFLVNFRDGGTDYDASKTTTSIETYHAESGSGSGVAYIDRDLANGTGFQQLNTANSLGNDNDQSLSGILHLFEPSSTTFVKHFMSVVQFTQYGDAQANDRVAGYCNTTTAIDGVQFKMSSGNIDAGDICLYGIN